MLKYVTGPQPVKFHKSTETADISSLLHSLLPARGDGDGHHNGRHNGRRRHRPQIRNGIRQAAAQAYAAILLVRQHGFTVAEAAQFTRSNSTAIAAMAVLNDNGDSDLLNAVVTDEVPFLPTAARLKPLVKARKAFSALSKLDRIEFARREGPEKLFNEIIVPASAPVTELVV